MQLDVKLKATLKETPNGQLTLSTTEVERVQMPQIRDSVDEHTRLSQDEAPSPYGHWSNGAHWRRKIEKDDEPQPTNSVLPVHWSPSKGSPPWLIPRLLPGQAYPSHLVTSHQRRNSPQRRNSLQRSGLAATECIPLEHRSVSPPRQLHLAWPNVTPHQGCHRPTQHVAVPVANSFVHAPLGPRRPDGHPCSQAARGIQPPPVFNNPSDQIPLSQRNNLGREPLVAGNVSCHTDVERGSYVAPRIAFPSDRLPGRSGRRGHGPGSFVAVQPRCCSPDATQQAQLAQQAQQSFARSEPNLTLKLVFNLPNARDEDKAETVTAEVPAREDSEKSSEGKEKAKEKVTAKNKEKSTEKAIEKSPEKASDRRTGSERVAGSERAGGSDKAAGSERARGSMTGSTTDKALDKLLELRELLQMTNLPKVDVPSAPSHDVGTMTPSRHRKPPPSPASGRHRGRGISSRKSSDDFAFDRWPEENSAVSVNGSEMWSSCPQHQQVLHQQAAALFETMMNAARDGRPNPYDTREILSEMDQSLRSSDHFPSWRQGAGQRTPLEPQFEELDTDLAPELERAYKTVDQQAQKQAQLERELELQQQTLQQQAQKQQAQLEAQLQAKQQALELTQEALQQAKEQLQAQQHEALLQAQQQARQQAFHEAQQAFQEAQREAQREAQMLAQERAKQQAQEHAKQQAHLEAELQAQLDAHRQQQLEAQQQAQRQAQFAQRQAQEAQQQRALLEAQQQRALQEAQRALQEEQLEALREAEAQQRKAQQEAERLKAQQDAALQQLKALQEAQQLKAQQDAELQQLRAHETEQMKAQQDTDAQQRRSSLAVHRRASVESQILKAQQDAEAQRKAQPATQKAQRTPLEVQYLRVQECPKKRNSMMSLHQHESHELKVDWDKESRLGSARSHLSESSGRFPDRLMGHLEHRQLELELSPTVHPQIEYHRGHSMVMTAAAKARAEDAFKRREKLSSKQEQQQQVRPTPRVRAARTSRA